MILRRLRFYSLAEVFFDEDPGPVRADVIECLWRSRPLVGASCHACYTLLVDLGADDQTLLHRFPSDTRYKIHRAEARDDLVYSCWGKEAARRVDEFAAYFDRFAAAKGQPPAPRDRLALLADGDRLDLSNVSAHNGETLVWHAHLRAGGRARLLHSASLYRESHDSTFRNLVGRANRWHHWRDLLRFKADGIPTYDFGGWYAGKEDEEKLRINRFKEQFRGRLVPEFSCVQPGSPKGRLVVAARTVLQH